MPTDTFMKLPEEKQRRVLDAAVAEFSQQPFSTASINRIVRNAGIPRGSFYQYFEDKEDLYLHLLTEIGKEKIQAIQSEPLPPDADFFESMRRMARTAFYWAKAKPDYYRIGMLMDMDDSAFIEKLKNGNREGMNSIEDMIREDQKKGRIREDIDPAFLLDTVYAVILRRLNDMSRGLITEEQLLHDVDAVTDLFQRGART